MSVLYDLLPKPDLEEDWKSWAQKLVDELERGELDPGLPSINVKSVTTTYTIDPRDVVVLGNHAVTPFTVTLPSMAAAKPRLYAVKNINAAAVTISAGGTVNIDNATTKVLAQWEGVILITDGSQWYIISDV